MAVFGIYTVLYPDYKNWTFLINPLGILGYLCYDIIAETK